MFSINQICFQIKIYLIFKKIELNKCYLNKYIIAVIPILINDYE